MKKKSATKFVKKSVKKSAKKSAKKPVAAKSKSKAKSTTRKAIRTKASSKSKKGVGTRRGAPNSRAEQAGRGSRSGQMSGDLQGLSNRERADSESVDELLEEGNAFEAEAVSGVEEADNQDGREVHTHEVPEDDVPEEYLDNE